MLSILIPTYNYNITSLVHALFEQVSACDIPFEILVFDDGSNSSTNDINKQINQFPYCQFKALETNIGRSAIRNLLAQNSKYEYLLFLDADVMPSNGDFIRNYIINANKKIVYGGLSETKHPPKKPKKLRWVYTKKREKKHISSANFFITKKLLTSNPFDETLKNYGCEDVLFFRNLELISKKANKINNPVIHYGNEDALIFIKKTELAIKNLIFLIDQNKIDSNAYKLSSVFLKIRKIKIDYLVAIIFRLLKPLLIYNFNSSIPSISFYSFYKLGYFCTLKQNK
jgi:glycosyltransferase involved in cell wall biosynthesis